MPQLYIIGAGGHARVIADILVRRGSPAAGFIDRSSGSSVSGIPVLDERSILLTSAAVIVGVGDNALRERLAAGYEHFGIAVHPSAQVAADVEIGPGSVVMAGAILNPGAHVGSHCIVNSGAVVEHDCLLEDFCSIGPGAVLGGATQIGRGAVIGLGTSVIHGIRIGAHTVVGAGSTAVENLPPLTVALGNPARVIRQRYHGEPYL